MLNEKELKEKYEAAVKKKAELTKKNTDRFLQYVEGRISNAVEKAEIYCVFYLDDEYTKNAYRSFEGGFAINVDIEAVVDYFTKNYNDFVVIVSGPKHQSFYSNMPATENCLRNYFNPIGKEGCRLQIDFFKDNR